MRKNLGNYFRRFFTLSGKIIVSLHKKGIRNLYSFTKKTIVWYNLENLLNGGTKWNLMEF